MMVFQTGLRPCGSAALHVEYHGYMCIRAHALLVCTLLFAQPLAAESITFEICAESTTWTRPTPEVQAKIWNDGRYKDVADTAYAWDTPFHCHRRADERQHSLPLDEHVGSLDSDISSVRPVLFR